MSEDVDGHDKAENQGQQQQQQQKKKEKNFSRRFSSISCVNGGRFQLVKGDSFQSMIEIISFLWIPNWRIGLQFSNIIPKRPPKAGSFKKKGILS